MNTTGHQIITGAFGGGFDEHGGFDFNESVFIEIVTGDFHQFVTHQQIGQQIGSAQIQITVF